MVEEAEELRALREQQPARILTFQEESKDVLSGRSTQSRNSWKDQLLEGCSPKKRLPILSWIRRYDVEDALSDLIAGVTLGLTMIPQSIAYATIAGLPSQYGLYAAFMGSLVYVFFGTVREVSIGPTSLMSLLTLQYTAGRPLQYVIVLAFTSGLVELAMGIFRLGFLVCFISVPVTSAFTSATALIIIGAQLGNLLGLPRVPSTNSDGGFFATVWSILQRLRDTAFGDTALGIGCMVMLIGLQHLPRLVPAARNYRMHRFLWYVSLARNALVVLLATLLAHYLSSTPGGVPFRLSGRVEPGIPAFEWPIRGVPTNGTSLSFLEITTDLGSGLLLVPLVAVLANVAIAKAFATDGTVDATQELIALGLCNVIGSCFRAMPTTGAFTRSAVSHASGVRTPLSGLYSALLTLLALGVLTPYFYYIPRATLAAVLIVAVASMLDLAIVRRLPRPPASLIDLFAWTVCFTVCLFRGVEVGLLCGMAVSLLEPLRHWVSPRAYCTTVRGPTHTYHHIRPSLGLLYTGIDRLRTVVLTEARHRTVPGAPILLDCEQFVALDYSAVRSLRELSDEVERLGGTLMLQNVRPSWQQALQLHETTGPGIWVFHRPEGSVPPVAQAAQVVGGEEVVEGENIAPTR
ncbi:sodium-independent sulfate anion transporter-like [Anopheles maculipalpis]|uniref:sodium-independent sulfate anion transporter-like n=1 Tax=Anopheles maculipalpis TaxID=1496333 RepID=UPI00215929CA|nr:sodium-independent sulfate anion transporter-like [Anopheles maculipalpis]